MALTATCDGRALDEQVVCLGAAGDKDHLDWLDVDERRHLLARGIHRPARNRSEFVPAGSVAVPAAQVRQHRLEDPVVNRRRRVVIEVDVFHRSQFPRMVATRRTTPIRW
jgi:hypothetical protein